MTIQELYDWAKERNLLDKQIAKHHNFDIEDIEDVQFIAYEFGKKFNINFDRVVVD